MNPTRVGRIVVAALTPSELRNEVLGDLHERYGRRLASEGSASALRAYYADVVASLPALTMLRLRTLRVNWRIRSTAVGCSGAAVIFALWRAGDALGFDSVPAVYAEMIGVTFAVAWERRSRASTAVLALFLTMSAVSLTLMAFSPEGRPRLAEPGVYLRFLRAGAIMGAVLAATLLARTMLRSRPESRPRDRG